MATRQITLQDVAGKSGVSVMTVSRVLRNHPNVSTETRTRIKQVAERLGYRPNPMVSALMRYRRTGRPSPRAFTLGFITNFDTRDGWKKTPLNREFFEGAAMSADRHGYQLEEFWLRESRMTARRLSQILHARNIVGLLIAPLPVPQGHLHLDWEKFSAVALGYSLAWPPLNQVVDQQFHSMRLALHRLRKLGYRRSGLAMRVSLDRSAHHHWTAAFLVEQREDLRSEQIPSLVVSDREWSESTFARWFQKNQPDVILSMHEEVMKWLQKMGLKVPEDVGFAHLNCPDTSGHYAGIYRNGLAVGSAAVDFLVDMIQRNERGIPRPPKRLLVEGTWQNGVSLRQREFVTGG